MMADMLSPTLWGRTLPRPPVLDTRISALVPALVRRWRDIPPDIDQAGLDQHFLSVHLGGPKRLMRQGEGRSLSCDVPLGAHSVVPAGSSFRWNTQGPVDFAHIYFERRAVDHVVAHAFDRDPAHVSLQEGLGQDDPLVRSLALALLEEVQGDRNQAYLDDLLHLLVCRILRLHSDARRSEPRARHVLAPYRLRRAIEFIETRLGDAIGVAQIADAAGISRYHFSRAFRQTTGKAPYAYLLERRVVAAKAILIGERVSLTAVARRCGFASLSQFSRMFKRETGVNPTRFRECQ